MAPAPGVQRVVNEQCTVEEPSIVGLDVGSGLTDRAQGRAERVGIDVVADVGGMDDSGQLGQCRIASEPEAVDEHLERALAVLVGELRTGCVERVSTHPLGYGQYLVGGHVVDAGVRIDEPPDQPR